VDVEAEWLIPRVEDGQKAQLAAQTVASLKPPGLRERLTLGTMAVAAGVAGETLEAAAGAALEMSTATAALS
jgi:hypothetical protein